MDLRYQRTCGVNDSQAALRAMLADVRRDSMGAINDALAVGHFVLAIDEDRAFAAQFLNHEAVVDNLFRT